MLRSFSALSLIAVLVGACGHVGSPQVIYLARHGQTEWNRQARFQGDPDLDPVGYVNRISLWRLLKDRPIHTIYTSEHLRTRRTAELVARQHELEVQTRGALNEIPAGIFEGVCLSQMRPEKSDAHEKACEVPARGSSPEATLREVRPLFEEAWRDKVRGKLPLAKSFEELAQQTAVFAEELERGLADREVLVIGHGVVNRTLLHHFMGWSLEAVAHLRQENDQVYRLEGVGTGQVRLSLYTPGVGWRECRERPGAGQKHLDCHGSPAPAPSTPRGGAEAPQPDGAATQPAD